MNNNDLIDRDALIKAIGQNPESSGNQRAAQILECILNASLVDAVPVVRCGECINYGYRNRHWDDVCLKNEPKGCRKWLDKMGMFIIDNPNDFCSYGERKSDE